MEKQVILVRRSRILRDVSDKDIFILWWETITDVGNIYFAITDHTRYLSLAGCVLEMNDFITCRTQFVVSVVTSPCDCFYIKKTKRFRGHVCFLDTRICFPCLIQHIFHFHNGYPKDFLIAGVMYVKQSLVRSNKHNGVDLLLLKCRLLSKS